MAQRSGTRTAKDRSGATRSGKTPSGKDRVARHRRAVAASGVRRLEVSIPADDIAMVRKVAAALRGGGSPAERARTALRAAIVASGSGTGADILAFFQASPLAEVDLVLERDRTTGRPIDL